MASGPISSWQIDRKTMETVADIIYLFIYSWAPKSLQTVITAMKLKVTCFLQEKL